MYVQREPQSAQPGHADGAQREGRRLFKDWDETERNWVTPGQRGERLRFQDFPAFHLISLAGLMKQTMMRRYIEPWGLSMPEWRVLSTVATHSPVQFARVAQLTAMDKAQVSRALRVAQGKGYVETSAITAAQRLDTRDTPVPASRVMVTITATGRDVHDQIMPLVQRDQLQLLQMLTADERRVLLRLAQRFDAALRAELAGGTPRTFHPEQPESTVRDARIAQPG